MVRGGFLTASQIISSIFTHKSTSFTYHSIGSCSLANFDRKWIVECDNKTGFLSDYLVDNNNKVAAKCNKADGII